MPLVLPPREGALLKARFRRALLGEQADADKNQGQTTFSAWKTWSVLISSADVLPEEL